MAIIGESAIIGKMPIVEKLADFEKKVRKKNHGPSPKNGGY